MSSYLHGTDISVAEVTNVGPLGFWILTGENEYFVPFEDYPVFQTATVRQIFDMEQLSPTQLHWPGLDADIETDALDDPEKYPLVWKNHR